MAGSLEARLSKLEQKTGGGGIACVWCGDQEPEAAKAAYLARNPGHAGRQFHLYCWQLAGETAE